MIIGASVTTGDGVSVTASVTADNGVAVTASVTAGDRVSVTASAAGDRVSAASARPAPLMKRSDSVTRITAAERNMLFKISEPFLTGNLPIIFI